MQVIKTKYLERPLAREHQTFALGIQYIWNKRMSMKTWHVNWKPKMYLKVTKKTLMKLFRRSFLLDSYQIIEQNLAILSEKIYEAWY